MIDWRAFHVEVSRYDWVSDWGEDDQGLWCAFTLEGVRQVMRWCPPGQFLMGSPADEPDRYYDEHQRLVTLSEGFWLAETACSQALWLTVSRENPSRFKSKQHPVEKVSWHDVQAFLVRLRAALGEPAFRLPTEAEWEYACRAGTTTPFCFGEQITPDLVNYNGKHPYDQGEKGVYRMSTVAVTELPANDWGLYQMHGNVREWCEDAFVMSLDNEAVDDPLVVEGRNRVVRGGSWDLGGGCTRSADRLGCPPDARETFIGFRFALGGKRSRCVSR